MLEELRFTLIERMRLSFFYFQQKTLIFTKLLLVITPKIIFFLLLILTPNKLTALIAVRETSHTGHNPEHVVVHRVDIEGRDGLTSASNERELSSVDTREVACA